MCGRFANYVSIEGEWESVFQDWPDEAVPGYNIAPTQVIASQTSNDFLAMRWGLVPQWSREATTKYATFNARAETMASKPAYRDAWRHSRRCLVPAMGYYEWRLENGKKQPYFIRTAKSNVVVFGALWETWGDKTKTVHSCSIITLAASGELKQLHPRMPLMINIHQAEAWLHETPDGAMHLVNEHKSIETHYYRVDIKVNNARNQGANLVEPI